MAASYGAETDIVTTDWNSLTDGSVGHSASVDNSSNLYHGADLEITLDTGGTGPAAGRGWDIWLEGSTDGGTSFPTDTTDAASSVYLGFYLAPTSTNTQRVIYVDTLSYLPMLPQDWKIKLKNNTGQTMGADNDLKYVGKKLA